MYEPWCNHVETFRLQHAWHGWKKFRTVAWEQFKAFYKDVDVIVFAWKPNASFGHRARYQTAPARALHWHRQLRLTAEDMRRLEGMFKDQVYYGAMQAAEPATAAANTRGAKGTASAASSSVQPAAASSGAGPSEASESKANLTVTFGA